MLSEQDQQTKTNAIVAYACLLLGSFTGIFYLVGGIWAMLKRSSSASSPLADHLENAVQTFWVSIILTVVGIFSMPLFGIGYLILVGTSVWVIYRCVKGLVRVLDNQGYN
ncbi:DUF4870 family protein [Vibrio barjaei]|uniref:DUF4870 family protein n=1 Tax=Vibrio barjaei TaxID=1676683 RepID=UPI0007BB0BFA|nr:hypothetical protein [Vibrio barjaei]OIN26939.1 hypothetical protein AWH66_2000930 [Vibrio barjaei]